MSVNAMHLLQPKDVPADETLTIQLSGCCWSCFNRQLLLSSLNKEVPVEECNGETQTDSGEEEGESGQEEEGEAADEEAPANEDEEVEETDEVPPLSAGTHN